jgi:tRNA pseudouridine13 synthase
MDFSNLSYLSVTGGIEGTIKNSPEDFMVEEIGSDGTVFEISKEITRADEDGDYTCFVMQKREWTTEGAIRRIAKELRVSRKRFSYAGNKDKLAVTTQLVSAFRVEKDKILSLNLRDIGINGAWKSREKVSLGGLLGNRFTVNVANPEKNSNTVNGIYDELGGRFPNYFGEQRFGTTRKNTHMVGEFIVRGRPDRAALAFLCDTRGEIHENAGAAREKLRETLDFSAAVREFPKHLRLERSMLVHLEKNPNDYAGALRRLPRGTLLMFVHAFQSYIFNRLLSDRIAEGEVKPEEGERVSRFIEGKIIGYETETNERERKILEELEIKTKDFKIKNMPEISSKGGFRALFAPLNDFSFSGNTFRFSLPAGSYATVALREFLDVKKS